MNYKHIITALLFSICGGVATFQLYINRGIGGPPKDISRIQAEAPLAPSITYTVPEQIDRRYASGIAVAATGELQKPLISGPQSVRRTLAKGEQLCRIVTGIVCGPGTTPIEGAVVEFVTVGQMHYGNVAELVRSGAAVSPLERIISGTDGSFEILNPRAGNLAIEVTASDHASLLKSIYVPSQGPTIDLGRLELQRGIRLAGLVVETTGDPVENATIHLISQASVPDVVYSGAFSEPEIARSNIDGSFETTTIEPGRWTVRVSSIDSPPVVFSGDSLREDYSTLHFVLEKGMMIRGQVVASDIINLQGMQVELQTTSEQRARLVATLARPWNEVGFRLARCDEQGRFALGPMPTRLAGELFNLNVSLDGAQEPTLGQPQATPGASVVLIHLEEPCYVEFGAFDAETGQSIQSLIVRTGMRLIDNDRFLGRSPTDIESLGRGRYRVRLRVDPRFTMDLNIAPTGYAVYDSAEIIPRPGGKIDLGDLQFQPQALDRILVVDALTNLPIADAIVECISADKSKSNPSSWPERLHASEGLFYVRGHVRAKTDDLGVALLTRSQLVAHHIVVTHQAYAGQLPQLVPIGAPPGDFEVRLNQGASLRVQVSSHGEPCRGAFLKRVLDDIDPRDSELLEAAGMRMHLSAFTNSDGIAVFEHLTPGIHRFEVDAPKAYTFTVEVIDPILYEYEVEF